MDTSNRSKYAHWKSNTNTNAQSSKSQHPTFNLRYEAGKYSAKSQLHPASNTHSLRIDTRHGTDTITNSHSAKHSHENITNRNQATSKYSLDLDRLLHRNNPSHSSSSSSSSTNKNKKSPPTLSSTLHQNISTRFQSASTSSATNPSLPARSATSVPISKHMHSIPSSSQNRAHSTHATSTLETHHESKKDETDRTTLITDKFQNIHLDSRSTDVHQKKSDKFLSYKASQSISTRSDSLPQHHRNEKQVSSKPSFSTQKTIATRSSDTQYNLSLIRPSDHVVLYSPTAHCYVCVSDFEEMEYDDDMKKQDEQPHSNELDSVSSSSFELYLKCDDMEGTALLIGENSFVGTCKFLADCKIQLVTGQGLCKDRDRIIVHSKHASKFMLQRYDELSDTGSMCVGHKVLIFVEASRSNPKQFWSFDEDTHSIILKELTSNQPTQNEIFVLQKYGQPLKLRASPDDPQSTHHDGYVMEKFFIENGATLNVQEFYLCHDILRVLSRHDFNGDFIEFTHDAVYGSPKVVFNSSKYGIAPILASAVQALQPLIQNTAQVRYFVHVHSSTEYGVVSQALCAEISKHLKDFNILLVQLETRLNRQELTLQNMRFYLQRATRSMGALQQLCHEIHMNKRKRMNLPSTSIATSVSSSYSMASTAASEAAKDANNSISQYKLDTVVIPLGCRGGALLNMIQKHIDTSGEKHVRILYNKLLKAASLPYFEMLSNWIYRGLVTDIFGEFMISEKRHLKKEDVAQEYNNQYWTGRYSLNRLQIPWILFDYQDIIVTTGKYLNVMRESGCFVELPTESKKQNLHKYSYTNSRELGQCIHDAYNFAAKTLLEMLMNRERIMTRFQSIGRYMLLQCGDWFTYFIDMAQEILMKNAIDIKKTKLDRLLELSMRTSNSSKNDPFKDDVCCDIKNKNLNKMILLLHDLRNDKNNANNPENNIHRDNNNNSNNNNLMSLTGIETFALNYKVEWPASIIFTGRNVIRYQLVFRFLFKLKFVKRELNTAWKQQMGLRELNLFNAHNSSLMLRHKMLSFIHSLLFYISYQVIEPNWREFMNKIKFGGSVRNVSPSQNNTVDSLLSDQEYFLRTTLEQCLLTNRARIDSLFKILICCEGYSNFVKRYTSDWKIYETTKSSPSPSSALSSQQRRTTLNMLAQDCRDNLLTTNFTNTIEKYGKSFEESVRTFLNDLQRSNDSPNININVLISRLDFNAYYLPKLSF